MNDLLRTATESLFWACAGAVVYTWVLYPPLIYVLSRLFGRASRPPEVTADEVPVVSILIVAHDEAAVIDARIRNALATDYPRDRLEIVVASDGSTDATDAIVRRHAGRGVRLLSRAQQRGKAAAVNWAMPQLRGDLVVLSDANTELDPAAVRRLARWFADPTVGVACGRLILKDAPTRRNADGAYWTYETFLKTCEARLGALLGVNGAIYAIRRVTFAAIPEDAIIDDFVIPLTAKINTGCAIVYDRGAIAREETAPDVRGEFRRRCRIATGGFRALPALRPLLDPRRGWIALSFVSHKVLRWFGPFFLLGAAASAASLWRQPFYRAAAQAQLVVYAAALVATAWPASIRMPRALRGLQMFAGMNVAIGVGCWRGLRRARTATWQPTERSTGALRRAA